MKKVLVVVIVAAIVAVFAAYRCSRKADSGEIQPSESVPATETEPAAEEAAPAQNQNEEAAAEEVKEEPAQEPAAETAPAKEVKKVVKKAKTEEAAPVKKETPKTPVAEKKPAGREEKAVPERQNPALNRAPSDANIDSAGVTKVINVSRAAIKRCYDKALTSNPQLKGKMSVKIVINQQGRVNSTEIVDDSLHDAEVAKCVKGVIGRLRFPKPADGTATVTFPFAFDPKNQ